MTRDGACRQCRSADGSGVGVRIRIVDGAGVLRAELSDAEDFDRFLVEIPEACPAGDIDRALTDLGRRDGVHVYVSARVICELAGSLAQNSGWGLRLTGMIGYAASMGWTDADGNVRAHIETVNEPAGR